jgi:hypothetical protein
MGKLVRIEKPQILLVQETKLRELEALQELQQIWKKSNGVAISARGASREFALSGTLTYFSWKEVLKQHIGLWSS